MQFKSNVTWIVIFLVIAFTEALPSNEKWSLRVMTLNTWNSGLNVENGLSKVVKHIQKVDPDIVALQELQPWSLRVLRNLLGSDYHICEDSQQSSVAILSKYPVRDIYPSLSTADPASIGCRIEISRWPLKLVNLWNVALFSGYYAPYLACMKQVKDPYQLYLTDYGGSKNPSFIQETNALNATVKAGRLTEMLNLMRHPPFFRAVTETYRSIPVLLMGDFSAPSHLDWVFATKSKHCDWEFKWPLSRLIADYSFGDSYRDVWPDPKDQPGDTWSPICKYMQQYEGVFVSEPQDRIDFIYYKGETLTPLTSQVYYGTDIMHYMPEHQSNEWPSDHAAVVTLFELR